ncbi:MAG TPA: hypothetical protein VHM31_20410 [Polyangia bacterium]|nr:hypothetical protein [Polyangia bacterium]
MGQARLDPSIARPRVRGASVVAAALSMVALLAVTARAAGGNLIVILQPSAASEAARRCLTRLREELAAGGFSVSTVDPGPQTDPLSIARAIESQAASVATIGLVGDPDSGDAELWIVDRSGGEPIVRPIATRGEDPARVPAVLAIRATEMLRASALQLLVESTRLHAAPAATPPAAPAPTPPPEAPPAAAWAVETGLAIVHDVPGAAPAVLAVLRARVQNTGGLAARLAVSGLGTQPRVSRGSEFADVGQATALAEIGLSLRPGRRVRPTLTLGAGALRATTDGGGAYPYAGVKATRWTGLFDAGLGTTIAVAARWALAAELHLQLAAPRPVVRFSGVDAATVARPALAATFTLVTWL